MSGHIKDTDHGLKNIKKEIKKMKSAFVNIGVLSSAGNYQKKEPKTGKNKSYKSVNLADIAAFNEFGTSRIPARPFMAQSFDSNIEDLKKFLESRKDMIMSGHSTTEKVLSEVGEFFQGKVQLEISKGQFEANSPFTIAMKGSDKPLVDTGRLRQSIKYEVKMK